jgi:hypothetical protein
MIDRSARRSLAENVRHLAAGVITNDEFEHRTRSLLVSKDPAIREIFWSGAWSLSSHERVDRFRGSTALSPLALREIARWIMFLQSDLPYEWPVHSKLAGVAWIPVHVATLGVSAKLQRRRFLKAGDFSVWPFICGDDQRTARRLPTYLR